MDDTKNLKLTEEPKKDYLKHDASDKEREVTESTFRKFRDTAERRNQSLNNFDGINLVRYIEDSYRRYTTNVDVRDDIEDWQATIHDQFTRNKVNAILAKIVALLPMAEVQPRGDEDIRKAQIITNLYDYSEDLDDYEKFIIGFLLEAIVKGTAIGYEGQEYKEQAVRDIVKGSGDKIKVRKGKKTTNRLYAHVVRLEDFYPATLNAGSVKELPYCFWRDVVNYEVFLQNFSTYKKVKYVEAKMSTELNTEDRPYYMDFISNDVQDGQVEIIRYYNKDTDEFVIIANGIWLNPIVIEGETEEVSPIPFNHKELPFFDIRFELFEQGFFYGKSLPDKLKNMQDVLNVLTNMLLDQSFLTIFPPLLTNGFDSIEDDYLRPGRRTPIDTQGLPIQQAFMKLDLGTPSGWHQYILDYTRKIMEESSVDRVSQGAAGGGDRTTAQEIRVAAEGVAAILGLFGKFVRYGIKQKALLRVKNILQFWTDPENPVFAQVLGEDNEMKESFNTIKVGNTVMSDGKRGSKIIEMYADRSKMPTSEQLDAKATVHELTTNKKIEYVAVDSEYLRNVEFDIKLVINQRSESTKDMEKALQMEKTKIYLSFFPDMVNKQELLAQLAEKMGDDPTKIISPEILNQMMGKEDENPMAVKPMSTTPENGMSNNAARSAMGGEVSANNMQQLQSEMLG